MVEILPATESLLERFWGEPPARALRALVLAQDGEPVAVVGFYPGEQRWVGFVEVKESARPALRARPRPLLVACRRMMAVAARRRMPMHAVAQNGIEAAERFLEHLGFRKLNAEIYEWRA